MFDVVGYEREGLTGWRSEGERGYDTCLPRAIGPFNDDERWGRESEREGEGESEEEEESEWEDVEDDEIDGESHSHSSSSDDDSDSPGGDMPPSLPTKTKGKAKKAIEGPVSSEAFESAMDRIRAYWGGLEGEGESRLVRELQREAEVTNRPNRYIWFDRVNFPWRERYYARDIPGKYIIVLCIDM